MRAVPGKFMDKLAALTAELVARCTVSLAEARPAVRRPTTRWPTAPAVYVVADPKHVLTHSNLAPLLQINKG